MRGGARWCEAVRGGGVRCGLVAVRALSERSLIFVYVSENIATRRLTRTIDAMRAYTKRTGWPKGTFSSMKSRSNSPKIAQNMSTSALLPREPETSPPCSSESAPPPPWRARRPVGGLSGMAGAPGGHISMVSPREATPPELPSLRSSSDVHEDAEVSPAIESMKPMVTRPPSSRKSARSLNMCCTTRRGVEAG